MIFTVAKYAGGESRNSHSNRSWNRFHSELAVPSALSAHCSVKSCSMHQISWNSSYRLSLALVCLSREIILVLLQGCNIPKHEREPQVFHSDCHFLLPCICCDSVITNLDWCMIPTSFHRRTAFRLDIILFCYPCRSNIQPDITVWIYRNKKGLLAALFFSLPFGVSVNIVTELGNSLVCGLDKISFWHNELVDPAVLSTMDDGVHQCFFSMGSWSSECYVRRKSKSSTTRDEQVGQLTWWNIAPHLTVRNSASSGQCWV